MVCWTKAMSITPCHLSESETSLDGSECRARRLSDSSPLHMTQNFGSNRPMRRVRRNRMHHTLHCNQRKTMIVDNEAGMTYSRRAARYLSQFRWYFPRRHQQEGGPSLDAAWAHYEHVTLARCYADLGGGGSTTDEDEDFYARVPQAERDERPTKLYPVLETPLHELRHFGLSTQMYFATVLVLSGIMGLAGLFNLPMMIYFWGYAENGGKSDLDYMVVGKTIRGSAICDATQWVECETCMDHADEYPDYRLNVEQSLVRRNICNFEDWLAPGFCSFTGTVLLLVLMGIAFWKQHRAEVVLDEAIQTASDYSIKISNPPPDALDPEEWRQFFNRYACDDQSGVVLVTIALNNAELINALIQRRQKLQALSPMLPKETNMEDIQLVSELVMKTKERYSDYIPFVPNPKKLWGEIQALEGEIGRLTQQEFQAISVFVTFETERSQRNALHALTTGKLNVWRNQLPRHSPIYEDGILRVRESVRSSSLWDCGELQEEKTINLTTSTDSAFSCGHLLFRGNHVLRVKEAVEPSDIRWVDLQASSRKRLGLYVASVVGMLGFVMCSGFFIFRLVKSYPGYYAAAFITMTNCVVPLACELINDLESHPTEHGKQISLYVKITIFRWFNSAIALSVISSFIESISIAGNAEATRETLLFKVYPVIVAELVFNPVIIVMDVWENFRKHVLAPRARNQEEMNACFSGGRFWLAERYTDVNRVLFVSLFFSAILPEAFLLGSMSLLAQFYTGKFCVLRLCGPTPDIGFHIARLSRNYFIPLILVTHVVMASYWWSGYPYDNVCRQNDGGYQYCNQSLLRSNVFPALPRFQPESAQWMSDSQETLTMLYGWTSVGVILVAVVAAFRGIVVPFIRGLYESTYEPDGMDQGVDFSSAKHREELHGYIPQAKIEAFVFPLLACDVTEIDEDIMSWKDPLAGYRPHSLSEDVRKITGSEPTHPILSIIRQWGAAPLVRLPDHIIKRHETNKDDKILETRQM